MNIFISSVCLLLQSFHHDASLCAPCAEPYSFSVCQKFLDDIVLVEDNELQVAMNILFHDLKLVVEPAAATAALLGSLKQRCLGRKIGIIICGSNIDLETFIN